jgi:predicted Fe-Mo cluster-binding NifX family protein
MNICIPSLEGNGLESLMCDHFGSAPYFTLYDTNNKRITTTANANDHHSHGSCMPVEALKEFGADAVLCRGMGMRAVNLLQAAGVKAFIVEADTVADAIRKFDANEVRTLDAGNACQSHACHEHT